MRLPPTTGAGGSPSACPRRVPADPDRRAATGVTPLRLRPSEADGFAEQQDGAAPGVEFCVEDEQAVDGAGGPVGYLGAGAFQRKAVVFDAAQRGGQVGYQLLRPDDPDRAGGAAGVGGQLAPGARGGHEGAGFGDRVDAAHDNVGACSTPMPRPSPTAAASPPPSCAPSKAASRSRAPGSRSPTGSPAT